MGSREHNASRPADATAGTADPRMPADRHDRERLRQAADRWVDAHQLRPPLTVGDLRLQARRLLNHHGLRPDHEDYVTVLLNNALWAPIVAEVPFDRRLLLLPQCLRADGECPAPTDAVGLLCQQCGRCPICGLQALAERLGYLVLVAEGTSVVTRLIDSGQVDAVIGVSCLNVLERAFPHLASDAIPGLAIPLLRNGCRRTDLDLDWTIEAIRLRRDTGRREGSDLEQLRATVARWFSPAELDRIAGPAVSAVDRLARDWMSRGGKRWRPFLVAAAWQSAVREGGMPPDSVRSLAVAVECFHKASLIHDDIEDNDSLRYGRPTLHAEHGIPIAINVGDALVGMGYRRIAECGAPPDTVHALLRIATEGHGALCAGQGEELAWLRDPSPMSVDRIVEVFRLKTAPAFEVALRMGLRVAGDVAPAVDAAVRNYSAALGIAYQIRDDLDDLDAPTAAGPRLSILYALAWETAAGEQKKHVEADWCRPRGPEAVHRLADFVRRAGVVEKARLLLDHHRNAAVRALQPVDNLQLRRLLARLVSRILPKM